MDTDTGADSVDRDRLAGLTRGFGVCLTILLMLVVDLPRRLGAIYTAVTLFVDHDLAAKEVAGVIADVRERATCASARSDVIG